jgi:hypothetical protein
MSKLLSLGVAAVACIAFFSAAGPAAAKDYEYCRRDVTAFMLQCGFDTLAPVPGHVLWTWRRLLPQSFYR